MIGCHQKKQKEPRKRNLAEQEMHQCETEAEESQRTGSGERKDQAH